jgi:hypothetical protein
MFFWYVRNIAVTRHNRIRITKFMMTLKSAVSHASPRLAAPDSLVSFSILLRLDLSDQRSPSPSANRLTAYRPR